ncbi:molybdopterin-dependent oxidoreductase [Persicobacter psychrovividus]
MTPSTPHQFKSTCSYCGVGCGIVVNKDHQGRLSVEGNEDYPVNRGMLCSKGMNLHHVVADQTDRLLHPMMRWHKAMPRQRVRWDQAIDRMAAVFKSTIAKHGPDSVGFYVSGQCTTEEYYLANKLAKGFLKTNNLDTNSRLCMSSAVVGYKKALGEDAVPIAYADIELADTFLITGANPAWCHPILFRRLEQHKAAQPEVKVICVDPRRTQTAAQADLHLQIIPGTDIILHHAIARGLIEQGWVDYDFVQNKTEGFAEAKGAAFKRSLREAAQMCGISMQDLTLAIRYIGQAKNLISMWTMGLNQSSIGVDKNLSLLNIHLITGQIGRAGAGPFSLTGQPNAMGGREVGGMANLLSAHRDLNNPAHRQEVADFWGVEEVAAKPGFTATEIIDALQSGDLKVLWIICTNPSVSLPDAIQADLAMQKGTFVIVQDISNRADTIDWADVVLPAAGWLEKEGTMTNSERRISYIPKVVDAPGEALPDTEILMRFAKKMGFHGFDFETVADIYDEHCALTKGTNIDISGLSHQRLKTEGSFQWPVPHPTHPGTPRLFEDQKFYTPSTKAQLFAITEDQYVAELPTEEYPLILTTGRIRDQWHTMTRTGKVNKLQQHIPQPFLEIHPLDANMKGIKEGMPVRVSNERGTVEVCAKITEDIRPGVVFLPMHWGKRISHRKSRANNLTANRVDPVSKEPDFKYSHVQVEKIEWPKKHIVIIGAGAAAYRFIQSYRHWNKQDDITVLSKEETPFYNRVLLPEYINGEKPWEELLKMQKQEWDQLNINVVLNAEATSIDREGKQVFDQQGNVYAYDDLVLCTGSRAFIPRGVPMQLPEVLSMRTRADADRLKKNLKAGSKVLIVGGGLLGLELAAALVEVDVKISMVQLSDRLMERQLDYLAADLLQQHMRNLGVKIYFNNLVQTVFPHRNGGLKVGLKSGTQLQADYIVYAIGTRPNIELAEAAGLSCGRGVKVDGHLKTSDPHIYAMGEIAEFQHQLFGITAAAEEQADICARVLCGDSSTAYQGSTLMNILKIPNLDLCSVGMPFVAKEDQSKYEVIINSDPSKYYYKKCIVHNDRLVGTILLGDKSEFAHFKTLISEGTELGEEREQLLRGNSEKVPMLGKLVCSCNNVGDGNIEQAIAGGCQEFNTLCKSTGAGLGCGSCKPEVQQILNRELENLASPVLND